MGECNDESKINLIQHSKLGDSDENNIIDIQNKKIDKFENNNEDLEYITNTDPINRKSEDLIYTDFNKMSYDIGIEPANANSSNLN